MRILKWLAVLSVAFSFTGLVYADSKLYKAPFAYVEVNGGSKIYVDYQFNSHRETLSCSSSSNNIINSIEWSYKNAIRKIGMPVTLKDDAQFKGYFADPEGRLTITNEFEGDSIFVTCQYHNMS